MAKSPDDARAPEPDRRLAARERLSQNPFFVLGLSPDAARAEIEREGQKLLGMLELGLSAARRYSSPIGTHERTSEVVREAMAELRDPERRLVHELWARLPLPSLVGTADQSTPTEPAEPEPSSERKNGEVRLDALDPFPGLSCLGLSRRAR